MTRLVEGSITGTRRTLVSRVMISDIGVEGDTGTQGAKLRDSANFESISPT